MIQYESDESGSPKSQVCLGKDEECGAGRGHRGHRGDELGGSFVLRLRRWLRPGDLALGRLEVSVWDRFGADVSDCFCVAKCED